MAMGAASIGLLLLLVVAGAGTSAAAAVSGGGTIRLHSDGRGAAAVMANERRTAGAAGDENRPWECCDLTICTRSWPPICTCTDKVEQCASTCEFCEQVEDGPDGPRYRCLDIYRGDPGPSCSEDAGAGHHDSARKLARGLADPGKGAAAVIANGRKTAGGDENRLWECCDSTICARSWPPICTCTEKVEQCASTCQFCEQVEDGPDGPRYRCLQAYRGDPGPSCSEDAGAGLVATSAHAGRTYMHV